MGIKSSKKYNNLQNFHLLDFKINELEEHIINFLENNKKIKTKIYKKLNSKYFEKTVTKIAWLRLYNKLDKIDLIKIIGNENWYYVGLTEINKMIRYEIIKIEYDIM